MAGQRLYFVTTSKEARRNRMIEELLATPALVVGDRLRHEKVCFTYI